jgi:hypothetical protein
MDKGILNTPGACMSQHQRILLALVSLAMPTVASGQTFHSPDPVIRSMWREGMEQSQLETLAAMGSRESGPSAERRHAPSHL